VRLAKHIFVHSRLEQEQWVPHPSFSKGAGFLDAQPWLSWAARHSHKLTHRELGIPI
jgi:hypothetical protein